MKVYAIILGVLLAGCTPMTQLIQDGNGWMQITQSTNQWSSNGVKVTTCDTLDNGFCPANSPTYVVVNNGPMPGVAGAGASSVATLGSAAIIRDGLIKGKSKTSVNQHNQTDVRASTVNPK